MSLRFVCLVLLFVVFTGSVQAQSPKKQLEWVDGIPVGDVTAALSATIKDNVIDLGIGKIKMPKAASLKLATISVKPDPPLRKVLLNLTISVNEPEQTLTFEGLQGYLEPKYFPEGGNPRSFLLSDETGRFTPVHKERFLRRGELKAELWNTDQVIAAIKKHVDVPEKKEQASPKPVVDLAKLLPPRESGYKPRSLEFAQLAAALSPQYIMPGRNTVRSPEVQRREAIAAALKYPSPELKKFAKEILGKADDLKKLDANTVRSNLLNQAAKIDQDIARGAYTRTERSGRYDTGPLGEQIPVFEERTIDDSASGRARAEELREMAALSDAKLLAVARKQQQTDSIWDALIDPKGVSNDPEVQYYQLFDNGSLALEKAAAKSTGAKTSSAPVSMKRLGPSTLRLRNVGTKTLTDVYVNFRIGYGDSEKDKSYDAASFLFVPVWKPDEDLDFQPVVYGVKLEGRHVFHAKVDVFATEASHKGSIFTLSDPKRP